MKKLILSLILLATIISVNSQSIIYGTQLDTTSNMNYFVSVDPLSGIITQLNSLPSIQYVSTGVSTFNSDDGIYIITDKNDEIYTIDVNTGAILTSANLSSSVMELHYDKTSGNSYGIEKEESAGSGTSTGMGGPGSGATVTIYYLASINPSTGVVTRIDSISGLNEVKINTSTYDPINEVFVFVGNDDEIFTLDINTASILSQKSLTISINELQLNLVTGNYYAIEYDSNPTLVNVNDTFTTSPNNSEGIINLVSVEPTTGIVTKIDSITGCYNFKLGSSTLDTVNGLYSIVNTDNTLFSVDLTNAAISSAPQLNTFVSNLKINVTSGGTRIGTQTIDKFEAFPNPARNQITVTTNNIPTVLNVFNQYGQLIKSEILYTETTSIDLTSLEKGLHFFKVGNSKTIETQKIIIE
ncbi:MAG: T9SS type A sorting domain-containing protein [Flavobacteriales bacterium]|nr:T9SS type A sorting domain-containing protein [Flavobacteriales bacterium]